MFPMVTPRLPVIDEIPMRSHSAYTPQDRLLGLAVCLFGVVTLDDVCASERA